jgi:hypothetical protein
MAKDYLNPRPKTSDNAAKQVQYVYRPMSASQARIVVLTVTVNPSLQRLGQYCKL